MIWMDVIELFPSFPISDRNVRRTFGSRISKILPEYRTDPASAWICLQLARKAVSMLYCFDWHLEIFMDEEF